MSHPMRFLVLGSVLVMLGGCSDTAPTAPAADANAGGPSDRAIIIRENGFVTWLGGGPPTNLALVISAEASIEAVCADGGSNNASPPKGIVVITPSGQAPVHDMIREVFVQVFESNVLIGLDPSPCRLVGAPLVATGRVFFSQTLNQVLGPGSGPGSFVFHATVHGIVDLTAGGQARLYGTQRFVMRPDGTLFKDQELVTLFTPGL